MENAADESAGVASADNNPLRMLRSVPVVRPRVRGNKHQVQSSLKNALFPFNFLFFKKAIVLSKFYFFPVLPICSAAYEEQ